jgi:hypothetical protein
MTGRGTVIKAASAAPISLLQRRGIVMPAQEESYESDPGPDFTQAALNTYIDSVGAVSVISEEEEPMREGLFQNRDGYRNEDGRYAAFTKVICTSGIFSSSVAPTSRYIYAQELKTAERLFRSLWGISSCMFWNKFEDCGQGIEASLIHHSLDCRNMDSWLPEPSITTFLSKARAQVN